MISNFMKEGVESSFTITINAARRGLGHVNSVQGRSKFPTT